MTTYTEAQYSTPSAMQMIRDQFLPANPQPADFEAAAKYMSKTLRIGGIKVCRALVRGAVERASFGVAGCAHEWEPVCSRDGAGNITDSWERCVHCGDEQ